MPESLHLAPDVDVLQGIAPPVRESPGGVTWFRIYRALGKYRSEWDKYRTYGPVPGGRFDPHLEPPQEQERGILYFASEFATCLAEVFQDTRVIDPFRNIPHLVVVDQASRLQLLDVTDAVWGARVKAPSDLFRGSRREAQKWSRAIYEAYPHLDGIYYPSARKKGGWNMALYKKKEAVWPTSPDFDAPLSHSGLVEPLRNAAQEIGYDLSL